jgi:1,2-diacylglycerol 3-alpha-glucosyltransferase
LKIVATHTDYRIYWPARLKALRDFLAARGMILQVIEIAGKGSNYQFSGTGEMGQDWWRQLFPHEAIEDLDPKKASQALLMALENEQPDVVLAGAIAFPSGATTVRWARHRNKKVIIMDNARLADVPRSVIVNWVKRRIYANVDAIFIPAPSHVPDYEFWGIPRERMLFGLNAVDNAFFAQSSEKAREDKSRLRAEWNLPEKFLLGAGRQVPKKNWKALLQTWALFKLRHPVSSMNLILIGNGPDRPELERMVHGQAIPDVHFRDFADQEELASLYGLAHALVLPSLYGETWGLVINEAMAAGLPVLASRECGCAETLVQDGINGWRFSAGDIEEMAACLARLDALSQEEWLRMGEKSQETIQNWGLERFCQGLWEAISYVRKVELVRPNAIDRAIIRLWKGRYRPT